MNELVQTQVNEIVTEQNIETIKKFKELEVQYKVAMSEMENSLKELMIANGIDTIDDTVHGIRITYKKPSVRKSVDTERLKREGLYELYLKESPAKDSVVITVKYD